MKKASRPRGGMHLIDWVPAFAGTKMVPDSSSIRKLVVVKGLVTAFWGPTLVFPGPQLAFAGMTK
jgi:hypothetical protein